MSTIQLIYSPLSLKKLAKIGPAEKKKAIKKIEELRFNPLAGKPLRGEFAGLHSSRAWPLRIIYTFTPKSRTITIITIDYRGSVYK